MEVSYDSELQRFVFDFEHDGAEDTISLIGDSYQVETFGKCFYYSYEFGDEVDSSLRPAFIDYVKSAGNLKKYPDITQFIQKAINALHNRINMYDYELVVIPQSCSRVDNYMTRYIYRFAQPLLRHYKDVVSSPINTELCAACSVSIQGFHARRPVCVDLLSGRILRPRVRHTGDATLLENVPFYDSPVVVCDVSLIQ